MNDATYVVRCDAFDSALWGAVEALDGLRDAADDYGVSGGTVSFGGRKWQLGKLLEVAAEALDALCDRRAV